MTAASGKRPSNLAARGKWPKRRSNRCMSCVSEWRGATSGLLGPSIDKPVAMGYVAPEFASIGTRINAIVRGKAVPMEVIAMPFVAHRYFRGN